MIRIVSAPIEPAEAYDAIEKDGSGSVLLHYAVVKLDTRPGDAARTCRVEYRENGDASGELEIICDEIRRRWNVEDVALVRRIGRLRVHDIISLVAVSSPNSKDAFEACRYGIEQLKKMTAIVKEEVFR